MGTAPSPAGVPAMPDPQRLVRRSIGLLKRLGMSEYDAALVVLTAATHAADSIGRRTGGDLTWICQVLEYTVRKVLVLHSSYTDYQETTNGDRSRRNASRAETSGTETAHPRG